MRSGADAKWVSPANLHLTLKFLGDVPTGEIGEVASTLSQGVARTGEDLGPDHAGPFTLQLTGMGSFPSGSNPKVIWVGVSHGREALTALALRVEAALARLGFPPDGRGFSPHLTLGRCRSPRNQTELRKVMDALRDYAAPPLRVDRVTLFASDLRPSGPVYTPLAVALLQPAGRETLPGDGLTI
jgi:2'-5' RNA ligase